MLKAALRGSVVLALAVVTLAGVQAADSVRSEGSRAGLPRTSAQAAPAQDGPGSEWHPAAPLHAPPLPGAGGHPEPALDRPARLAGRVICLDPGHDARYLVGAAARGPDGTVVFHEHRLTMDVALRVRELLEAEGALVCLTRDDAGQPNAEPYDYNGNGTLRRPEDLPELVQPRTDWMNAHGAEIVLSIHFNGHPNPALSGTEVYFSDAGPSQESNWALAGSVLTHLLAAINGAGYHPVDRGLKSDAYKSEYLRFAPVYGFDASCFDCRRLLGLGNNPMAHAPGAWQAGALVEVLFFSNPGDVAFLMLPEAPEAIAQGLAAGVMAYAAP